MEREPGGESDESSAAPNPGFLSRMVFWWMNPLLYKGFFKKTVWEQSDLYKLEENNKAKIIEETFEKHWNEELHESLILNKNPSMIKPTWRFLRKNFIISGIYSLTGAVLGIVNALMIGYVVEELQKKSSGKTSAKLPYLVLALCIGNYIVAISYHRFQHHGMVMGMRLRIALTCLVYKKVLKLSRVSVTTLTGGRIINLVSNDARKFDRAFFQVHYLWLGPLTLIVVTILSLRLVGWPALIASGYVLLLIPGSSLMGKQLRKTFLKVTQITDQRVRVTGEAVSGVRAIKMYAWEIPLSKMIKLIRRAELWKLYQLNIVWVSMDTMFTSASPIVNLLLYTSLSLTGFNFNPQIIFTTMALYEELRIALSGNFVFEVRLLSEGLMALERIRQFLLHPEKGTKALHYDNPSFEFLVPLPRGTKNVELPETGLIGAFTNISPEECDMDMSLTNNSKSNVDFAAQISSSLVVDNVTCYWNSKLCNPCLSNINLKISRSNLVAVCGEVGSGKSSLLSAILGELLPVRGTIRCNGLLAYAPQLPWVFSGTLRQNIIFGQPYDKKHYQDTLEACQLVPDIESFPDGDLTYIGERGITLSGGQRARVSLARAVYFKADIYLLDDPLSALDIHVGKQLFTKCIKQVLNKSIVVLVTHNLSYLPEVDQIIVMKKGCITAKGTYSELMQAGFNLSFKSSYQATNEGGQQIVSTDDRSIQSGSKDLSETQNLKVEDEGRSSGSIPLRIHWEYFRAGNSAAMAIPVTLLLILSQVLLNTSEWWLAQWTNQSYLEQQNRSNVYVYVGICCSFLILSFTGETLLHYTLLRSNQALQEKMLMSVIKSPVLFFDTNPAGRILNKFSKDIGYMDQELPSTLYYVFLSGLLSLGSLILVAAVIYWAAIAASVIFVLVVLLAMIFLKTSRDLKRLEAVNRSPLYSQLKNTLEGLTSIQCLKAEERCIKDFQRFQNEQTRAWYLFISGKEWLGLRLELLAVTYLAAAAIAAVVTSANAGISGLALYASFSMAKIVQYTVFFGVEYENLMTSVERVHEYINLPSEPGYQLETQPPANWVSRGEIEFKNVSLVYYKGGSTILRDINFRIEPKEKVGIVGRTGAGKSSLLAALFRMPEAKGTILIDGVDISTLNCQSTRKVMSVIPQDPVLFSGDLRNNLDPFTVLKDEDLWLALQQVELKDKVESLPGQLRYQLSESGSNLSIGERQLVCLARALLQNNKIIIIDEATANVDHETDQKIQKTIRRNFSCCTVLTIAHRLDTVMDSDKVLVLSEGKIAEYDAPRVLLNDEGSLFFKLVKELKESKR